MELTRILSNGISTAESSGSTTRQVVNNNVVEMMVHTETIRGRV
jgi:hypothetical protein